ncbi:hypothetical protein SKAU_G00200660 [Synaphobranchus kaupii]|uniref:Uncharacterized protein n=1 Tax=Synaphobranchus kaupii TaxID=118154 RepID=A0A9Q1FFQ1_SYNKA|nr:hypothetical protein SKAU_G00200660 [Synaphobranchus kaupii]
MLCTVSQTFLSPLSIQSTHPALQDGSPRRWLRSGTTARVPAYRLGPRPGRLSAAGPLQTLRVSCGADISAPFDQTEQTPGVEPRGPTCNLDRFNRARLRPISSWTSPLAGNFFVLEGDVYTFQPRDLGSVIRPAILDKGHSE